MGPVFNRHYFFKMSKIKIYNIRIKYLNNFERYRGNGGMEEIA